MLNKSANYLKSSRFNFDGVVAATFRIKGGNRRFETLFKFNDRQGWGRDLRIHDELDGEKDE